MEAIEMAIFFQKAVNRLRVWRCLSEHIFSRILYDRSLNACTKACREDMRSTKEIVGHGFRQIVSRLYCEMPCSTRSIRKNLLDSWIRKSPSICSAVLEHSFSGIAVIIKGTSVFVTVSTARCPSNPFMRHPNPTSILKRPKDEKRVHDTLLFSKEDLHQIADSAHVHLNVRLMSHGCSLHYDQHLHRLALYYSREARDFGVMRVGNCRMARTVFEVDIEGVRVQELGSLVSQEILKRLCIEGECREAWGAIGVVEAECKLWVSIVCYYQGLYL